MRRASLFACLTMLVSASLLAQGEQDAAQATAARTGTTEIQGQALPSGRDETVASADARRALTLTVYNGGHFLVDERRQVPLISGLNRVAFDDVPATVRPGSARIEVPAWASVLSRYYHGESLSRQRLLEAHVGRRVMLVRESPNAGERLEQAATLVGVDGDRPILRIGERIEVGGGRFPWRVAFDNVPAHLHTKPMLGATVQSEDSKAAEIAVSYLATGLDWRARYTLHLNAAGDAGRLEGWAQLENRSGTAFANARVRLVAGEVATEQPSPRPMMEASRAAMADSGARREALAGGAYHLYSLPRAVTLEQGASRQLPLLSADAIPVSRHYRTVGQGDRPLRRSGASQPVQLLLGFDNADPLREPLPAGRAYVYADAGGQTTLLGVDSLEHTARGEPVELTLGQAFDINAKRRQTAFRRLDTNRYEIAWRITVTNAAESARVVDVQERIAGDWQLISASRDAAERDANGVRWRLEVPAGGEVSVEYRVEVRR